MKNMPLNDPLMEQTLFSEANGVFGANLRKDSSAATVEPYDRVDGDVLAQLAAHADLLKDLPGGYHCCRADEGYPFLYIGEQFLRLLGWTREEITARFGGQYLQLVHPEDREQAQAYIRSVCAEAHAEGNVGQVYRLIGKDGFHWVTDNKTQVRLGEETIIQGCITDLTQFLAEREKQHELEMKQRLNQEQLQNEVLTALGQNYDAIFRINLLHDIYQALSCRDSIKHYYGDNPSANAMLAKMCEDIVAPTHYERMRRFFDLTTLAARLREREFIETECITKKGVWHRARLIVRRRDGEGNVTHVLYVTQIINDEKQYEEHLIARAEYADLANRSKTSFVSQVAHDIRTPMNSIFGFLEIAEANLNHPEKIRYSLENIRTAGQFLKKLVDDVLDISRMEDGRITLQPEIASLTHMAQDMANTMRMEAKKKKQTFCLNVHDILHDDIVIDGLRFVQIHTNVLSNAVNYTPMGGSIEFDVHQEEIPGGDRVRTVARIKDTGIGMSAETMSRMFDKFERGTDTRINKVSGYGLGLSIVKQLLELMGGTIEARSMPGQGTTFTIRLETPYVQQVRREEDEPQIDAKAACRGMHLLVAEDNDLNREVITELLAMYDITCECVENGALCVERLRTAQEGAFAAVLMDMQMPVMDGVEATRRIRALKNPWARNLPIIAMTANAMKDDVQRCLEAGMDRHLSKPVDMMLMLKTLAEVVNERKMKG